MHGDMLMAGLYYSFKLFQNNMDLVIIALLIFAIVQKSIPPCCIFFEMLLLRDFNSACSLISKCNIQTIIITDFLLLL